MSRNIHVNSNGAGGASPRRLSTVDILLQMNPCEDVSNSRHNCAHDISSSGSGPATATATAKGAANASRNSSTSHRQPFYVLSSSDGTWFAHLPGATGPSCSGITRNPQHLPCGASWSSSSPQFMTPKGVSQSIFRENWGFMQDGTPADVPRTTEIPTATTTGKLPLPNFYVGEPARRGSCSTSQEFHQHVMEEQRRQMGQLIHQHTPGKHLS
ncbi:uncharacterized protein TEOVI_000182100 [Trypanosoma equiperdum]|nr:hypothetical protein, conserved [Trypanosoma equiperdum]